MEKVKKYCCLAAVDIGSNASRLLIQKCDLYASYSPLQGVRDSYYRIPVRLGVDVFSDGKVSETRANELAVALKKFHQLMKVAKVEEYRVCATSALRNAYNSQSVIDMVEKVSGLKVDVISGEEEANLVRDGFVLQGKTLKHVVFVDVGGGSTEVSLMNKNKVLYSHSFSIGSMRGLSSDASAIEYELLKRYVRQFKTHFNNFQTICTGGNIHMVSNLLNNKNNADKIKVNELRRMYENVKELSPLQIVERYALNIDRAEILVPAMLIYLIIADALSINEYQTPPVSLRYGIVASLLKKRQKVEKEKQNF